MLVLLFTQAFQAITDWMLIGFNFSLSVLLFAARTAVTSLDLEALHRQPICLKTVSFW